MAHKITVELDWDDIELLSNTVWAVDWDDMPWVIEHEATDTSNGAGFGVLRVKYECADEVSPAVTVMQRTQFLQLSNLRAAANALASIPGKYTCKTTGVDVAEMILRNNSCNCVPRFIIEYALTGEIQ